MPGSAAEERIRGKAETLLRSRFPSARIIHELVLRQGGVRIDLAAVTPDLVILAEIKSERDVLTRLPDQAQAARRVGDGFIVCCSTAHAEEIERLGERYLRDRLEPVIRKGHEIGRRSVANPDYVDAFRGLDLFSEADLDGPLNFRCRWNWPWRQPNSAAALSPFDRLHMLWADELRWVAASHRIGVSHRTAREESIAQCSEMMTGREVRRAVCAALRFREFPRADPPIEPASAARIEAAHG